MPYGVGAEATKALGVRLFEQFWWKPVEFVFVHHKPVRVLIHEMASDLVPQEGHLFLKDQAVDRFAQRYPKIKEGTISAHLLRLSTNAPPTLWIRSR